MFLFTIEADHLILCYLVIHISFFNDLPFTSLFCTHSSRAFSYTPPQKSLFSRLWMTFLFWQCQNVIICCYLIQSFSSIWHSLLTLVLFPLPYTLLCLFLPCWLLLLSLYWWPSFWWFSKLLGSTKGSVLSTFSLLAFSPWLISSSLMALNSICTPESSIIIITANQGWVLTMCQALYSKSITLV